MPELGWTDTVVLTKMCMRWVKWRQRYYALIQAGKEGLAESLLEADATIETIRVELDSRAASGDTVAQDFLVTLGKLMAAFPPPLPP